MFIPQQQTQMPLVETCSDQGQFYVYLSQLSLRNISGGTKMTTSLSPCDLITCPILKIEPVKGCRNSVKRPRIPIALTNQCPLDRELTTATMTLIIALWLT